MPQACHAVALAWGKWACDVNVRPFHWSGSHDLSYLRFIPCLALDQWNVGTLT